MKATMSLDGYQKVDVPIFKALEIAKCTGDTFNELQIRAIGDGIFNRDRITKADYDYILDYIRRKDEKRINPFSGVV